MTLSFRMQSVTLALGGLLAILSQGNISRAAQESKENVALYQQALDALDALDGGDPARQRAALAILPELGQKSSRTEFIALRLKDYLTRTNDEENKILALRAFGKLAPSARTAAIVLKPHLTSGSDPVRRAAATALAAVASSTVLDFGKPAASSPELVGILAGAGAAVNWHRAWIRFGDDGKELLPLCSIALRDRDERVKAAGADAMRLFAGAIGDNLPDPATSNAETRSVDPFEAKLKWLLLQEPLTTLNAHAPALDEAIASTRKKTALAGTRAAQAVMRTRALALASRRYPSDELAKLVAIVPSEDPLRLSATALLPALAKGIRNESREVRLAAIEALESSGAEARSELKAIVEASANRYVFVRWVAARTLGELFAGAGPEQSRDIADALAARVADPDLDVRNAALTALGKGKAASLPATDAILRDAASDDPDQRALAIKTLGIIEADNARTVPVVVEALKADSPRVRKAAATYLGAQGRAAKSSLAELQKLLQDPDDEVRREAAQAIFAISAGR